MWYVPPQGSCEGRAFLCGFKKLAMATGLTHVRGSQVGRFCKGPNGFDSRLRIDKSTWNILNNDGRPAPMVHQFDRCDKPDYDDLAHFTKLLSKCPHVASKLKSVHRELRRAHSEIDMSEVLSPTDESRDRESLRGGQAIPLS
jgi:hypothetical protein